MDLSPHPEKHLLFIRSWKTSTILVSKAPFTREEIVLATEFCDKRSFDLAYYAGMDKERANRYDVQDSPQYFQGAKAITGSEAASFHQRYAFDVSETTDDRPFFSHFFRWDKAPMLLRQLRREWLPMVEMGYVFILATLVQAVLASTVLILFPLLFLRRVHRSASQTGALPGAIEVFGTLFYFACIGLAFMFLEMALLPSFTLLLSHPVYSAAVVLSTVLVFAGCGSLTVRRLQSMGHWFLWVAVAGVSLWVTFYAIAGHRLFHMSLGWSFSARIALSVLLLSIVSFFLGWPFPWGLRVMARQFPSLVPWAWGINGCASVIGAVLGKCLAVSIGFRLLMFSACILYILAITIFYALFRNALKE
jgi:hypothetical protein